MYQPNQPQQQQGYFQPPQQPNPYQNPNQQSSQIPLSMANLKAYTTSQNQETELQIVFNNFLNALK